MKPRINVIGGGLAGSESALNLLDRGFPVRMYEMRPKCPTGAHKTDNLAELVCSNSLKSTEPTTGSGLLKEELDILGCKLLPIARECAVPAGSALSIDREKFSKAVEAKLFSYKSFELIREEVVDFLDGPTIIATGPLTSLSLANKLSTLVNKDRLYFYDAIAPIVSFESIDMNHAFFGGRYGKGGDDYLNLPMTKPEYENFYNELIKAESVILKDFEKKELFDGCMPIEEMAKRGSDTIRFGPLKPVGIKHPVTGEKYYAVVQLRKENIQGDCYNLVGFQTNLKFAEQKRVFSMIPALKNAEFIRYGQMHRNTYINSPGVLDYSFRVKGDKIIYIAGQLSGVEGYMESIMSGLIASIAIADELEGKKMPKLPLETITGALCFYVSENTIDFKPMNANFGILPNLTEIFNKSLRKKTYHDRAINAIMNYTQK